MIFFISLTNNRNWNKYKIDGNDKVVERNSIVTTNWSDNVRSIHDIGTIHNWN